MRDSVEDLVTGTDLTEALLRRAGEMYGRGQGMGQGLRAAVPLLVPAGAYHRMVEHESAEWVDGVARSMGFSGVTPDEPMPETLA